MTVVGPDGVDAMTVLLTELCATSENALRAAVAVAEAFKVARDRLLAENAALRAALAGVCESFECYFLTGPDAKPDDECDEDDLAMRPKWRAAVALLAREEMP